MRRIYDNEMTTDATDSLILASAHSECTQSTGLNQAPLNQGSANLFGDTVNTFMFRPRCDLVDGVAPLLFDFFFAQWRCKGGRELPSLCDRKLVWGRGAPKNVLSTFGSLRQRACATSKRFISKNTFLSPLIHHKHADSGIDHLEIKSPKTQNFHSTRSHSTRKHL